MLYRGINCFLFVPLQVLGFCWINCYSDSCTLGLIFNDKHFGLMQIHYDRTGKDGLFSHKEISVLYVPDLSECLPSLETWRDQWLTHKKAIAERERQLALKKEVCYTYFTTTVIWKSFCLDASVYLLFGCYENLLFGIYIQYFIFIKNFFIFL